MMFRIKFYWGVVMQYLNYYSSPLGQITMVSDGTVLTRLFFTDAHPIEAGTVESLPIFVLTSKWLDIYFQGQRPSFDLPMLFKGTEFQIAVWRQLLNIPYGKTTTYGKIAKAIAEERGLQKMSAQAVGGAVGRNPICLLVPCHRVIGTDGSMTGYAEGIQRKTALLQLEGSLK